MLEYGPSEKNRTFFLALSALCFTIKLQRVCFPLIVFLLLMPNHSHTTPNKNIWASTPWQGLTGASIFQSRTHNLSSIFHGGGYLIIHLCALLLVQDVATNGLITHRLPYLATKDCHLLRGVAYSSVGESGQIHMAFPAMGMIP